MTNAIMIAGMQMLNDQNQQQQISALVSCFTFGVGYCICVFDGVLQYHDLYRTYQYIRHAFIHNIHMYLYTIYIYMCVCVIAHCSF